MGRASAEVEEVAALLRETAQAHHEEFTEVDGADPEWPLWYAKHLAPRVRELLHTELTVSELVHSLMLADEAHADDGDWAETYAVLLVERHADAG